MQGMSSSLCNPLTDEQKDKLAEYYERIKNKSREGRQGIGRVELTEKGICSRSWRN